MRRVDAGDRRPEKAENPGRKGKRGLFVVFKKDLEKRSRGRGPERKAGAACCGPCAF